jgi:MFS family permease
MAMSTGTVIGAMISGRMMGAMPHYKRPTIVGLAFAAIGTTILAITAGGLPLLWFEALLALIGIGIGTHFPLTTVSVQNAVEYHELGTATANLHFFRQLGSAVVVSIYSAVFLDALGSGVDQITTLDALAATAAETGIDLSAAFRLVFFAAAATLVLSFVAIVAMKESPLRGAAERARSSSESS